MYRGTVINYKIEGILSGTQPLVVGNGKANLIQLITEKNKNRGAIAEVIPDEKMNWFLKRQLSFDGRLKLSDDELIKPWEMTYGDWNRSLFETYIPAL